MISCGGFGCFGLSISLTNDWGRDGGPSICKSVLQAMEGGPPPMSSTRRRVAVGAVAALALVIPLAIRNADAATTPNAVKPGAASPSYTAGQVLAGVQANMTT